MKLPSMSININGHVYGKWTVLEKCSVQDYSRDTSTRWVVRCDCGFVGEATASNLRGGRTRGCQTCLLRRIHELGTSHGHSKTDSSGRQVVTGTYKSWQGAKQRCFNHKCTQYPHYGGRGISMSENWVNSFDTFLADMGERPKGRTLDRIDVNGNYEKNNCRWATASEQAKNRRPRIKSGDSN